MSCHGPLKRLPNPNRPYGPTKRNSDSKVHSFNHLKTSFDQLRTGGQASGLDGIRYDSLDDYQWTVELKKLRSQVKNGSYKPSKPRACPIPKGSGGTRTLSIPNIRDRVVSKACLNAIEEKLESIFLDWSYAFRPNRNTFHVFANLIRDFNGGLPYCCHYDINRAFDNVSTRKIKESIRNLTIDIPIRDLLLTIVSGHNSNRMRGLNQGDPLSGALFNLYMHDNHDQHMAQFLTNETKMYRYADDLVIIGKTQDDVLTTYNHSIDFIRSCSLDCDEPNAVDLNTDSLTILGLTISGSNNKLSFSLPLVPNSSKPALWQELGDSLEKAHQTENPSKAIKQTLLGTLEAIAPVELTEDHQREVNRLLERHGLKHMDLKEINNTAHWNKVLKSFGLEHTPPREEAILRNEPLDLLDPA